MYMHVVSSGHHMVRYFVFLGNQVFSLFGVRCTMLTHSNSWVLMGFNSGRLCHCWSLFTFFSCQSSLWIWWNSISERRKFTMLKKLSYVEMHFGNNRSSPCTTWSFIFAIPKSYSLSKFTLVGRKFTLYRAEVHFNTSRLFLCQSQLWSRWNFCLMEVHPVPHGS
jgi:hypothetical protein